MDKKIIVVSDDIYPESRNKLNDLGYEVLFSFNNQSVNCNLSKHTDMQLTKIDDNTFVSSPECYDYYSVLLKKRNVNLICGNTFLNCNYPYDIAYNINIGKKYAVHNFEYTDLKIMEKLHDKTLIDVKQGYTSCTLCRIGDNEYITSDNGIYKTMCLHNINVLKISEGDILLPGFDYGFFGGASIRLDNNTIAVNGNINYHNDSETIISFCRQYNVNVISLSDKPIMDIGSGVLIDN